MLFKLQRYLQRPRTHRDIEGAYALLYTIKISAGRECIQCMYCMSATVLPLFYKSVTLTSGCPCNPPLCIFTCTLAYIYIVHTYMRTPTHQYWGQIERWRQTPPSHAHPLATSLWAVHSCRSRPICPERWWECGGRLGTEAETDKTQIEAVASKKDRGNRD